MHTKVAQATLTFLNTKDTAEHPVLNFSVITEAIRAFQPELLNGSTRSNELLDLIADYLFQPGESIADRLETQLPEPLFLTLYGLKSLLVKSNWNTVSHLVAEHKARFAGFIQQEILEEE